MTHLETTMSDWLAHGPRYVSEGITSVRITDKEPGKNVRGEWFLVPEEIDGLKWEIPECIAPKYSFHASRDDAQAFLSESCIIWARQQLKEQA